MTYARKAKPSQIGYKRGRKSSTVDSRPPSDAFRANYDLIDWSDDQKTDRAEPGEQTQEQNG